MLLSRLLSSKGATFDATEAEGQMCVAASEGDVIQLQVSPQNRSTATVSAVRLCVRAQHWP